MKLFFVVMSYLNICGALVNFDKFNLATNDVANSQSPLFYVAGLINDWNQNNLGVGDVVVFNIGRNSELSKNVVKAIPKENAVLIANTSECKMLGSREVTFVIITSNTYEAVSI